MNAIRILLDTNILCAVFLMELNMNTYHQFTKRVSAEGRVIIDNLPPDEEVNIRIVSNKHYLEILARLQVEFQQNNPLAQMSEEKLHLHLRQERDKAYEQLYGATT